jgi:hypothetical protein
LIFDITPLITSLTIVESSVWKVDLRSELIFTRSSSQRRICVTGSSISEFSDSHLTFFVSLWSKGDESSLLLLSEDTGVLVTDLFTLISTNGISFGCSNICQRDKISQDISSRYITVYVHIWYKVIGINVYIAIQWSATPENSNQSFLAHHYKHINNLLCTPSKHFCKQFSLHPSRNYIIFIHK